MVSPERLESVAVVGNGKMGHGIAQVFAVAGVSTTLIGRQEESLARALEQIEESLGEFEDYQVLTSDQVAAARKRLRTSTDIREAQDSQLVVEAVPFERQVQLQVLRELDEFCDPSTVIATASGEIVSRLYGCMRFPERAIAVHFWYPAQLIPIVEICGGPQTAGDVVAWTSEVVRSIGKVPAILGREVDGFIGNRIQFAMLREAWSMWANGVASAETIDAVVRNTIGRRLSVTGPIESADLGGLRIMHSFGEFLFPVLDAHPLPPKQVTELVEAGHCGLQSGQGVYDWSERDGKALLSAGTAMLFRHLQLDA